MVAELAFGVVVAGEALEGFELRVKPPQGSGRGGEELGPMGTGLEGSELFFDEGQQSEDFRGFGLPGEVDGEAFAVVCGAEPERVGGDGAEFGDEEVGCDEVAELLDGEDCFIAAGAGDEVFSLELCAAGRGERPWLKN